jgi:hypothetical protein
MPGLSNWRWTNPSLPQTLQIAVWLLYATGVLGLLLGSVLFALGSLVGFAALAAAVAAGLGISNERKWGYLVGLAVAVIECGLYLLAIVRGGAGYLISLLFAGALVALLVHPMSRDYQRIWFR